MRIKVHVQGIKGSRKIKEGEDATVLFGGVLEVDGHLIEEVTKIEAVFGWNVVEVKPILAPGSFEIVTHTEESWPELLANVQEQQSAYAGTGKQIVGGEE